MQVRKTFKLLWDFGRPHTLIGSFLSITTLYLLATGRSQSMQYIHIYAWVLLSALACNVFITGLNQIVDVEMDKINKPFLPIAAGRLSSQRAQRWIVVALVICLATAMKVGGLFFYLILSILVIGIAYSVPPLRLKRHHLPASLCIVIVRGILVNYGIGYFFELYTHGGLRASSVLLPLTVFMTGFSFAIAWFKDLYDVDGDRLHQVDTLAVLYSIPVAYRLGNGIVIIAFIYNIIYPWVYDLDHAVYLILTHLISLLTYLVLLIRSTIHDRKGIYRFYMSIWVFFFVEYLIYMVYGLIANS